MNEKQFFIEKHINPDIQINDKVKLIDGSAFSLHEVETDESNQEHFIVDSYPSFGLFKPLEQYTCNVIATNLTDTVLLSFNKTAYLQDIIVSCEGVLFRTCSAFVKKVY